MLWSAFRVAGIAGGLATATPEHIAPSLLSLSTSLILVVAAWLHWWLLRKSRHARIGFNIAVGMSFGLVGDIALSQTLLKGLPSLVVALSAFGVGHAAYLIALKPYALRLPRQQSIFTAWCLFAGIGVCAWYPIVYEAEIPLGGYAWLVLAYGMMLASLAGLTVGLARFDPRFTLAGVGGVLFFASDLWIGMTLFNPQLGLELYGRFGVDMIWLTYSPAQLCIVYTTAIIWRRSVEVGLAEPAVLAGEREHSNTGT